MKSNKIFLFLILMLIAAAGVSADGNEIIDLLKSPDILADGGSYTSSLSPMADIVNPAASGAQQRTTLNASFTALLGDQTASGYNGSAFNIGITLPTRSGVITGSGFIVATSALSELNAGFQGGVNASFSKELYPGLLAGAGINLCFGESWSATADLGFIQDLGDVGIMQNLKWAIVLGNMGYSGFSATDSPSVFTPGLGAGFDLINIEGIEWAVNADLNFPSFSNIKFNLGTGLSLFDFAGIQISSAADLNELISGDISALIPAFGIYFNLQTDFESDGPAESGWSKNDIRTSVSAAPLANGLWAAGVGVTANVGVIDQAAPLIEIDLSGYTDGRDEKADMEPSDDEEPEETGESDDVSFRWKKDSVKSSAGRYKNVVANGNDKVVLKSRINNGNINQGPEGEQIITYLSPNNDGVKDYMEIPVSIQDSRYIKGFAFIIQDEQGTEVKRIENKEKRPENLGLANFFERLFYVEKGVDIPDSVRWDGIDEGGNVVEDGFYRFFIEAWDDNGNKSVTPKYGLVIDNTPPRLELVTPPDNDKIFSPNDDGNKDILDILQDGSTEDKWTAVIKSADGKAHKNYIWKNGYPQKFSWNGKDDKKLLVPDGVYFYYIEAVDRAGNRIEGEISNIIINTQSTPISLSVDASNFAPGIKDSRNMITFVPDIPVKSGISEWSFKIASDSGLTVKEIKGTDKIPAVFEYKGEKNSGGYISEGGYKGYLDIRYTNGNNPSAVSPGIIADTTAPSASAKVSLRVFSPNGDGNKDQIIIYQETSIEDVWYGEITKEGGDLIQKFKWVKNAVSSFEWEGYTEEGTLAKDGEYVYRLYTADQAGNKGESSAVSFRLDTEETPVILTVNMEAFSPNGDGVKENISIAAVLNVNQGIQSYAVSIIDAGGNTVKTITGQGKVKDSIKWDGFTDEGRKAADGIYNAVIKVVYEKGDVSTAATREFRLDSVYPAITAESEYTLFSPDGDGNRDFITIKQQSSREELISALISDSNGKIVREFFWQDRIGNIEWNGTDVNGNKIADGKYTYSISSEDKAGNRTEQRIQDIEVDTRTANVFVTASDKGFTPNQDGESDKIEFSTIATLKDGVRGWELNILKNGETPVKSFVGEILPEKIIWDGRGEDGRVTEGDFSARYKVYYYKGNEPVSVTKKFALDISAPETVIDITPKPFSPDNDGVDDELSIFISVTDQSKIDSWALEIVDREGNAFTSFGGKGAPAAKIQWDGIGKNGELVLAAEDYPYKLRVRDEYGNESIKYGIIPIDVLVVMEGNKLKIRIANITFAPDSAELRKDDPEIKEKNIYVLGRLSEILQKYESYKILIEGHAVSVFWANTAKAEKEQREELLPLSKARAETVKYYLEQLGISGARMSTEGIGGRLPIVPHGDLDNRWKNRRVEFILLK
ncbi:MAG: OmpA family protein [Spirochaetales bacterium]|nr:OmpA family protein [Spirochaetales bacterium]